MSATLAQVTESVGPISVLVNAAGINEDQLLVKSSAENIRHLLDVNLVGSMVTCKAAVRGMIQRRAGCIINIGIGSRFKLFFFFFFFLLDPFPVIQDLPTALHMISNKLYIVIVVVHHFHQL